MSVQGQAAPRGTPRRRGNQHLPHVPARIRSVEIGLAIAIGLALLLAIYQTVSSCLAPLSRVPSGHCSCAADAHHCGAALPPATQAFPHTAVLGKVPNSNVYRNVKQ